MRDPLSPPKIEKVATAIYLLAGLLLAVTVFHSCTISYSTTQYGNHTNHCEAYQ